VTRCFSRSPAATALLRGKAKVNECLPGGVDRLLTEPGASMTTPISTVKAATDANIAALAITVRFAHIVRTTIIGAAKATTSAVGAALSHGFICGRIQIPALNISHAAC
jgi:hypothetical protein